VAGPAPKGSGKARPASRGLGEAKPLESDEARLPLWLVRTESHTKEPAGFVIVFLIY
jgi:hypothetical protein